jgi:hypothetical protein
MWCTTFPFPSLLRLIVSLPLIATMLGIQELDDLICLQLARRDLIHCAQVSKKWHSTVTPHLWRDLSWLSSRDNRHQGNARAFCMMLLEDCLAERQYQKLLFDVYGLDQPSPSPPLSPLSVNGHWIGAIPGLSCLYDELRKVRRAEKLWSPTPFQLYQHLIERCSSDVQVDHFQIEDETLNPSQCDYHSNGFHYPSPSPSIHNKNGSPYDP